MPGVQRSGHLVLLCPSSPTLPHHPRSHAPSPCTTVVFSGSTSSPPNSLRPPHQQRLIHQIPLHPVRHQKPPPRIPPSDSNIPANRRSQPAKQHPTRPQHPPKLPHHPLKLTHHPSQNAAPRCRSPHPQTHPRTTSPPPPPPESSPPPNPAPASPPSPAHTQSPPHSGPPQNTQTPRAADKSGSARPRTPHPAPASQAEYSPAATGQTDRYRYSQTAPQITHHTLQNLTKPTPKRGVTQPLPT